MSYQDSTALPTGFRAVIYCRVSTEEQAEDEVSITAQIRECQDYATRQSWPVLRVFKDEGMSGRTDERPDFQQMIAWAKQRPAPFDVIVVWKLNRFSRTLEHRVAYQSLLRRRGIKIVSLKEPALERAMAVLVEPILAAVDEFMALQVSEATLRGLKEIARQGYSAGGRLRSAIAQHEQPCPSSGTVRPSSAPPGSRSRVGAAGAPRF